MQTQHSERESSSVRVPPRQLWLHAAPIDSWRHAKLALEGGSQKRRGLEASHVGDLVEARARRFEQPLRGLDAGAADFRLTRQEGEDQQALPPGPGMNWDGGSGLPGSGAAAHPAGQLVTGNAVLVTELLKLL